jgi:hypothetical protein
VQRLERGRPAGAWRPYGWRGDPPASIFSTRPDEIEPWHWLLSGKLFELLTCLTLIVYTRAKGPRSGKVAEVAWLRGLRRVYLVDAAFLRGPVLGRMGTDWAPRPRRARVWSPRRSVPGREEDRMAFQFRLETEAGSPADPPSIKSAVPNWRPGDTIPLGKRALA